MKSLFTFLFLVVSVALAVEGPRLSPGTSGSALSRGGKGGELKELQGPPSASLFQVQPPNPPPRDQNVDPGPNSCCFDFVRRPIPLKLLKSFYYTSGRCSKAAVVFVTKKDVKMCADPSEQWVQDRIRDLSPH
ncbi:C-C motif chemokine 5-like [Pantherophis guttatus]|uniref:C-C motif chemokine n=1 Tax=Pantherophis guttatus TaxID=94885 RepID=A0ABM3YNB3_PANGU|nr:C-C motif chemokine 5-like [Pantherophis guttatus]